MTKELRPYQLRAVEFLETRKRGFVISCAGSGKTIIAAHVAARVAKSGDKILWIANTIEQKEQGISAIEQTPGPEGVEFEVCCAASYPDASQFDIVIIDEGHHAGSAITWKRIVEQVRPEARLYGFSATPWSNDPGKDEYLEEKFVDFYLVDRQEVINAGFLSVGKVYVHDLDQPGQFDEAINRKVEGIVDQRMRRYPLLHDVPKVMGLHSRVKALARQIEAKVGPEKMAAASAGRYSQDELQALGIADLVEKAIQTTEERNKLVREEHTKRAKWQVTQEFLQANETRNSAVVQLALDESRKNESVLVLVQSIEHGESLAARVPGAQLAHSKLPTKARRKVIEDFRSGALMVLFATSLADEGLDVPRASRLILVSGGRSAGKLEQRAGRVLRPHEGKNGGVIHDFLDAGALFSNAQAKARFRTYSKLGYEPEVVSYRKAA